MENIENIILDINNLGGWKSWVTDINPALQKEIEKVIKQDRHTEISIFNFELPSGQPGQILVFHDYESAGIVFGDEEPIWGDWDDYEKTLTIGDDNAVYNKKGELLTIDPF